MFTRWKDLFLSSGLTFIISIILNMDLFLSSGLVFIISIILNIVQA